LEPPGMGASDALGKTVGTYPAQKCLDRNSPVFALEVVSYSEEHWRRKPKGLPCGD
jgi:hypothetical protein